jgi:hypothetical protein
MTVNQLLLTMGANEFYMWMAYDKTQNPEWREKADKELAIERQREYDAEQEAKAMKALFEGLAKNGRKY